MGGGWWGSFVGKRGFLRRLHKRVGYPWPLTPDSVSAFTFEASPQMPAGMIGPPLPRWTNIDQLEAVVEFYWNFNDPWIANTPPPRPWDSTYKPLSLHKLSGSGATLAGGTTVLLDGAPDLTWVLPNPADADNPVQAAAGPGYPPQRLYLYDTLYLEADILRRSRRYRIMSVDNAKHTVTLDTELPGAPGPQFAPNVTSSAWRIETRPILVLIDPFGARKQNGRYLRGDRATIDANDGQLVHLDGGPGLTRVNRHFDTIYLAADTVSNRGLPMGAYRIVDIVDATTIRVEGTPVLAGGVSKWNLPSGLSGDEMPQFRNALGQGFNDQFDPPANSPFLQDRIDRGRDHYDGALFVVSRGSVLQWFRWTSFTSRDWGLWPPAHNNWGDLCSSLRGNQPYFFYSYRSPEDDLQAFKNYTFMVTDPRNGNGGISWVVPNQNSFNQPSVHESAARFYYGIPNQLPNPTQNQLSDRVEDDTNGKEAVEIHRGNRVAANTGSGGCLVSPSHIDLRNLVISLYLDDYSVFYGVNRNQTDAYLRGLETSITYESSQQQWHNEQGTVDARQAAELAYNKKLAGILWVVRPDEPPIGMATR